MKKSDLDFWQGMAAHYTKFMRRSAPVYAEICNRIRPHLTRDMNVLELASGTASLSPVSVCPAVGGHRRLFQYDRGSEEADRIFPAPLLGAGRRPSAVCLGNL